MLVFVQGRESLSRWHEFGGQTAQLAPTRFIPSGNPTLNLLVFPLQACTCLSTDREENCGKFYFSSWKLGSTSAVLQMMMACHGEGGSPVAGLPEGSPPDQP